MFDPKAYREACRELTASENKIEEIIAMTENTNRKARRPLRTALICAAAVAMTVVSVAAANPEGVEELFFNLGNVVRIDRYRSDVTTEEGNTFALLSSPEARVVDRDGRAVLTLNGEDVMDITDALAKDRRYVFEDFSEDTRVTVTVDGSIDQWTIETEIGVVEEDGSYTRFGSTTVTSEDAENNLDGGVFFNSGLLDGRTVDVANAEITTGMYVTVDKDQAR